MLKGNEFSFGDTLLERSLIFIGELLRLQQAARVLFESANIDLYQASQLPSNKSEIEGKNWLWEWYNVCQKIASL